MPLTMPSSLVMYKEKPKEGSLVQDIKAFGEHAAASLIPSAAALAVAGPASEAGATIGGPVGAVVGGIGGALVGGYLGGKAQGLIMPKSMEEELAKTKKESPKASFTGELATGGAFFGPAKVALATHAIMGGVGGGIEAARQVFSGEHLDASKIAIATGVQSVLVKPTKLGEKIAPAFKDTSNHLASTGFKDEKGNIIPTGPKHPEEMKAETITKSTELTQEEQTTYKVQRTLENNLLTKKEKHAIKTKPDTIQSSLNSYETVLFQNKRDGKEPSPLLLKKIEDAKKALLEAEKAKKELEGVFELPIKKEIIPKYEQGFITESGEFLDRHAAAVRAKETGQIKKDHKLERPEEGLHSGDLRTNKDRNFSLEESPGLPKFANGVPVYEGKTGRTRPDGTPIAATLKRNEDGTSKILIDTEQLKKDFADKVWTKPKLEGVAALPEDAFKTPAEYTAFVLAHEREHTLQTFDDFHKQQIKDVGLLPKSEKILRGEYENEMNKRAMELIQHPFTIQSAKELIGSNLNNIRANSRLSHIFKRDIEKAVPNEIHRETITLALENPTLVRGVPHLAEMIGRIDKHFKELGTRAKKEGVISGMYENYVTHMLDWKEFKGTEAQKQAILDKILNAPKDSKLVRDFSQQRQYETLRELEKAIEGTGVKVQRDIAKIVEGYSNSMETAILHKQMIDKFVKTDAPNGKPLLVPVTPANLKEGYVPFQGKGSKVLEGHLVHPDLAPVMGQLFRQTDPNGLVRAMGAITHLTKALNTVGSFFHATSLGQAHLLASPTNALRELFSGGKGVRQAVETLKRGGDATIKIGDKDVSHAALTDGFIRQGLVLESEDIKRTIIPEMGLAADKLLSKFGPDVKLVQRVTEPLEKHVLSRLNSFTWDYMHAGQKLNLATNLFVKAKVKNPEIPDEQLQKEISKMVNETFGGLNWAQISNDVQNKYAKAFAERAANIQGREWAQILLFAPDWTVSTLRAFTSAFPKEINKPQNWDLKGGIKGVWNPIKQGDFARRYVLNTAIAYFTILNAINFATSKHYIWENKDPMRIDLGDGTSMQAAKHSMEFAEWLHDPTKTFGNKMGFIPKATYIEISGHAYPSLTAPKLKPSYEGYGGMEMAKGKAILTSALPFQVGSAVQAPSGQGASRAFWSTVGLPKYGLTHEQMKEAQRKGRAEAQRKKREKRQKELDNS